MSASTDLPLLSPPPAASPEKVTSDDIRAALLKHYAPPSHRVFFEVSNDTGTRASRWIDAVAVGIWPSTGHEIIGIEIKVSRSDWQREMKEPAKAQSLMRFCTRWFLVCPEGLVKPDELPATWGMLSYRGGSLRTKVTAKLLEPDPISPGFMMAVLRNANGIDGALISRLVAERVAEQTKGNEEWIEREVARRAQDLDRRRKQTDEVAAKLAQITGVDPSSWEFDPSVLGAAYKLIKASGLHILSRSWGDADIPGVIRQLGAAQATLQQLHDQFSDIRTEAAE